MSLEAALLIARSGLLHTQRALAAAAHDVANAETPGHTNKIVPALASQADGRGLGVRILQPTRTVDGALAADLDRSRASAAAAELRERMLQRVELAHGRPEAGEGLGDLTAALQAAFLELRSDPSEAGRSLGVVLAAEDLAARFNQVAAAIGSARQEAQDGIVEEVARLNAGLREIAALTRQIQDEVARGHPAAELEDRRDAAITRLSESLEVRALKGEDGSLTLIARGGVVLPLREGGDAFTTSPALVGPAAFHGSSGTLPGILLGGVDVTRQLAGGRLPEYVALRDSTLPRYQAELDLAAAHVAARFEAQGLRLFTGPAGTVPDVSQPYAGSAQIGFAGVIQVNPAVAADPRLVRDGTHGVAGGGGPTAFTPNPQDGPAGFVTLLDRVLGWSFGAEAAAGVPWDPIPSAGLGPDGSLVSPFAAPPTLAGYAADLTAAHTADRVAATGAREQAVALRTVLEARFAQQSGVDVDAEMAAMVSLQNAYAANAKVMGTVQAMWDSLLSAVR